MSNDASQGCPTLERLEESAISAAVDGEVVKHLSHCAQCRISFDQIKSDNDLLRELAQAMSEANGLGPDDGARAKGAAAPVIEGYELMEEIHRGGQGVVFKALQKATRRIVAIKMLLQGAFATSRQRRRFEREVEIVAEFRHPNIVTLHDCGQTPGGEMFLVMEYVDGVRLDEYLHAMDRTNRTFIRAALGLFAQIADAVAAAHQRGIIHRDLKPANILVVDETGSAQSATAESITSTARVKVLDFGLAQDVAPEVGANDAEGMRGAAPAAMFQTKAGEFHGTIAYAAPEQLSGEGTAPHATALDVYALGVLLYEMLTGASPYKLSGSLADVVRSITASEPRKASQVNRFVDHELNAIISMAMAKDPERRYRSAGALADDVRRYLEGRPISAKRDSGWYVIRKVVSRHKAAVATAAAVLLMIIGFAIVMTILFQRSVASERLAQQREAEIKDVAEFQSSVISGMNVQAMGAQLRQSFDREAGSILKPATLGGADLPEGTQDTFNDLVGQINFTDLAAQSLDQNLLARTIEAIDSEFPEPSTTRAMLLQTVARSYREIGLHQPALDAFRKVREIFLSIAGERDPRTIDATIGMAAMLHVLGRLDEAERELVTVLAIARQVLGEDAILAHAAAATLGEVEFRQGRLDDAAIHLASGYQGLARLQGADDVAALRAQLELGQLRHAQGKYDEADKLLSSALATFRSAYGNNDARTHAAIDAYASLLQRLNRYPEAETLYREALEGLKDAVGNRHPSTIMTHANLGTVIQRQRRLKEAEPYYLAALEGYQRIYGQEHAHTLTAINNLGVLMESQGRLAEAKAYYEQAVDGRRRVHGDKHPFTLTSIANLALTSYRLNELEKARDYMAEALAGRREILTNDHPSTMDSIANLGAILMKLNDLDTAEPLLNEALERRRRVLGNGDANTLNSMGHLAELHERRGDMEAALKLSGEAMEIARGSLPAGGVALAMLQAKHGRILRLARQWTDAEANLLESHAVLLKLQPAGHESVRKVAGELRMLYEQWHEAEPTSGHDARAREFAAKDA